MLLVVVRGDVFQGFGMVLIVWLVRREPIQSMPKNNVEHALIIARFARMAMNAKPASLDFM